VAVWLGVCVGVLKGELGLRSKVGRVLRRQSRCGAAPIRHARAHLRELHAARDLRLGPEQLGHPPLHRAAAQCKPGVPVGEAAAAAVVVGDVAVPAQHVDGACGGAAVGTGRVGAVWCGGSIRFVGWAAKAECVPKTSSSH